MTTVSMQPCAHFRLADVRTVDQLARALGVPLQVFHEVIACQDPGLIYAMHSIPKRSQRNPDGFRVVWESRTEAVARSHKAAARRLDDFARRQEIGYPNPAVHGYVRGGSTRSNALPHCGARVVVRADIEDFFQTITLERVESAFRAIGIAPETAHSLALFSTINGKLPLGLPESPVVSNLVCLDLDRDLKALADRHGVKYTRYADDMTFSGNENLPSREEIRTVLLRHGFRLSDRKFKKSKRGQAHFVTGLSVSERDYPHVPRKLKRMLRLELHFCEKYGLATHAENRRESERKTYLRIDGMVNYVSFIERRKSAAIKGQWDRIRKKHLGSTLYARLAGKEIGDRFVVADETEFEVDGIGYLAICFVRLSNLEDVEKSLDLLLGDYLTKPGAKGNLDVLKKVGIHYADAHFDLRTMTLDLMTEYLQWSASICFSRLRTSDDYKEAYLRMFAELVKQEFVTSDGLRVEMLVENNDKIKLPALTQVCEAEYRRSESEDGRRPISLPSIRSVKKSEIRSLTLADFVLAAFRAYVLRAHDDRVLDFERIRDRVRYVRDSDSDNFYTRKKPFLGIGDVT
ncbi:reverse transcriptase family protein [Thermomonas sp. HDW16]|uniref:reverse transcriptase family protein n=1 Tax=Thermomonas sp. HDW16 TaxID=2714945 RepID=UPI00140A0205|nr:reverse transcriptase family protein [Thermomonas sp. HDW16]QIL20207.1 RNA-directed DNA polymerase [Thermomonas sp. HDW16]